MSDPANGHACHGMVGSWSHCFTRTLDNAYSGQVHKLTTDQEIEQ